MIRIISGKFNGRLLMTPEGLDVRPTADRVKTALFNILGTWIEDLRVLDLFAGVGSIGIEALSRGAQHVTFVEKSAISQKCILHNINLLGLQSSVAIMKADVNTWLERARNDYDFIYIDPPYRELDPEKLLTQLDLSACYHQETLVVVEHYRVIKIDEGQEFAGWRCYRSSKYGKSILSFFKRI